MSNVVLRGDGYSWISLGAWQAELIGSSMHMLQSGSLDIGQNQLRDHMSILFPALRKSFYL